MTKTMHSRSVNKSDADFNLFRDVTGGVTLHIFDDDKDQTGENDDSQQFDPQWQASSLTGRNNRSRNTQG